DIFPAELNRSNNVIVRYLPAETGESGGCLMFSDTAIFHGLLLFLPLCLLAGWKSGNRGK
ncbi:MAG TPA: hypothetical protein PK008_12605, partial [Aminivibrio sp.]|uniref:hypothetical protein n=1 Tax=Aminivibrio sp. TaxID=1872489 RepID=UPI002B8F49CB